MSLEWSPEEMRAVGYAAVDAVVDWVSTLDRRPAYVAADPAVLLPAFAEPPPEGPADPAELLDRVMRDVVAAGIHGDHRGMFGYIPVSPTFAGAVADFLASGANVFAGTWQGGPGAAAVELATLGWLRDLLGLDPGAEGVMVSGGSAANLVGLAAARDTHDAGADGRVAYATDQAHSSVARALRLLGLPPARIVATDARLRMQPEALGALVREDRLAGRRPWCVVASAGTTNTGAVDPLVPLAEVCREEGLWLHVDGAYGGLLALCERGRREVAGLELADSLVLDAHKSLFVPLAAGIVYTRAPDALERTFAVRPEYLADAHGLRAVHFSDRSFELSRPFRALKVWLTLKTFGFAAIRRELERGIELAHLAARLIDASPALERVTGPDLGVVTFRSSRGVPVSAMVDAVTRSGEGFMSSTVVAGAPAARLCILGHRATEESVRGVLQAAAGTPARASA